MPIAKLNELRAFIAARLYDLEIRLHKTAHPYAQAFESLRADENHNSASILIRSEVKGTACLLLGKRIGHEWYCDFGGKSERADGSLFNTAAREVREETAGQVTVSAAHLEDSPSHDLITENGEHTHRMFISEHKYIPSQELLQAVKEDTKHTKEYTHFTWVPINDLLAAIENNTIIQQEGQKTLEVSFIAPETGEQQKIALYPPIAKILQQEPVKALLEDRKPKATGSFKRTRSHAEEDYHVFRNVKPKVYEDWLEKGNSHEAGLRVRLMRYGNKIVPERVYTDPETEHKDFVKTVVASAALNQEIKRNSIKLKPVQEKKSLSGLVKTLELKPKGIQSNRKNKRHATEMEQHTTNKPKMSAYKAAPLSLAESKQPTGHANESKRQTETTSQSLAYLQGLLAVNREEKNLELSKENDPKALIDEFFSRKLSHSPMAEDQAFKEVLLKAVLGERDYSDRVVLYHATNSKIGYFYDFISMLRSHQVFDEIRSLRAFDEVFAGIEDVEAFLVEQCQKQFGRSRDAINDTTTDYQEKGLCCNFSLFANSHAADESTIHYLYDNKSCDYNEKSVLIHAFAMVLNHLNIQSVSLQEFIDLYDAYQNDLSPHLYQIFIAEEQVDNFCYFSNYNGRYHKFDKPWQEGMKPEDQHKLLPVIRALRNNPKNFLENEEIKKQSCLEARLFLHPRFMHDRQNVTIKTHTLKEKPPLLQQELLKLVQRIALELLQKQKDLKASLQGSTQGQPKLTPLQRKYAYAAQGERQEAINFNGFSIETLYHYIESLMMQEYRDSETVLTWAATKGRIESSLKHRETFQDLLETLLENKKCTAELLRQLDENGDNALTKASKNGRADSVKLLLDSKAYTAEYIIRPNKNGHNALSLAAKQGYESVIKAIQSTAICSPEFLLKHAADPISLISAVILGYADVVDTILKDENFKPEYLICDGNTILHWAIKLGDDNLIRTLLKNKQSKALVLEQNADGETAFTLAIQSGNAQILKAVLESTAFRPELFMHEVKSGWNKYNALVFAAQQGHTEILKVLLDSSLCTSEFLKENGHQQIARLLQTKIDNMQSPESQIRANIQDKEEVKASSQKTSFDFFKSNKKSQSARKKTKCIERCVPFVSCLD